MKKVLALVLAMLMILSLAACGGKEEPDAPPATEGETPETGNGEDAAAPASDGDKVITIGGLYPLTGSAASSGKTMQYGINYAIQCINDAGGVGGYKLDVVWGDTQGDAAVAVTQAENLIAEENVDIVMGCYQSGVTLTASAVGEQYGCPFITANATSETLTAQGYEYFFRLAPTNMMFLRDMVQFCRDYSDQNNLGLKTAAICVDNTEVGQQTIEYAEYWAKECGIEIVGVVTHPSGAADLSSEVLQLKDYNADILIADQYVSDAILLTNTMVEQGYQPGIMIVKANGYTEADYVAAVGGKLNGIMMATEFIEGSKGSEISDGFKEFSGEAMNGHSAEAYTVVYTIAEAINNISGRGEEVTRDTLQAELAQISIKDKFFDGSEIIMPYDTIEFCEPTTVMDTEYLHTNLAGCLTIAQYQDGKLYAVYPESAAQKDVIYPAPFK